MLVKAPHFTVILMALAAVCCNENACAGKVIGNFYDSKGKATQELRNLLKSVREHEADLAEIEKEKNVLPPCNVEWNKEQGYRVWCTIRRYSQFVFALRKMN
jgi:hypothetical protein